VAVNPFQNPPKGQFFLRLIGPGVPVMLLAMLTVGFIGRDPSMQPRGLASQPAPRGLAPVERAAQFYRGLGHEWAAIPDACWGRPDSEFQQGRCEDIWAHLARVTAVGLLPLGAFLAFALFALDSLKLTYRRIRKKIGEAQYGVRAVVTRPARVRGDPYAWFYCFHCISVELHDKTQLRVYLSPHENIPFPGDTVAIFKLGHFFGKKRYMATLYAPHVAVFAAVRAK
jgi:hypothetical protein